MDEILSLMNKGEGNLSKTQMGRLRLLAASAQAYEKSLYTIDPPSTLEGMIELKMFEKRLKQKELAKLMDLANPNFRKYLLGKDYPMLPF